MRRQRQIAWTRFATSRSDGQASTSGRWGEEVANRVRALQIELAPVELVVGPIHVLVLSGAVLRRRQHGGAPIWTEVAAILRACELQLGPDQRLHQVERREVEALEEGLRADALGGQARAVLAEDAAKQVLCLRGDPPAHLAAGQLDLQDSLEILDCTPQLLQPVLVSHVDLPRSASIEALESYDAQRPEVAGGAEPAFEVLRRHVRGSSSPGAEVVARPLGLVRQHRRANAGRGGHRRLRESGPGVPDFLAVDPVPGQTEVQQLQVALRGKDHVVRLDVSVYEAGAVDDVQRLQEFGHVEAGLGHREPRLLVHVVKQISPLNELHNHVHVGSILESRNELHKPPALSLCQDLALAERPVDIVFLRVPLLLHLLQGVQWGICHGHACLPDEEHLSKGALPQRANGHEVARCP
mmetsp:Transcript_8415/g.22375  ORF Transcript_8415/g.22375 Transcript_8415/m.22375 type:complete len:412 (+) Transcript_8415:62-1297(+)